MILPARKQRVRSGIERVAQREFPRHRRWVRSHGCCVPGCASREIEFAHMRSAANSGIGYKPHDAFGVPLCRNHHRAAHDRTHDTLAKEAGVDLWALAMEFARRSPCAEVREYVKALKS